jgi:hypothetical protein
LQMPVLKTYSQGIVLLGYHDTFLK